MAAGTCCCCLLLLLPHPWPPSSVSGMDGMTGSRNQKRGEKRERARRSVHRLINSPHLKGSTVWPLFWRKSSGTTCFTAAPSRPSLLQAEHGMMAVWRGQGFDGPYPNPQQPPAAHAARLQFTHKQRSKKQFPGQ